MSLEFGCEQPSAEIEVSCVPAPFRQDAVSVRRPRVHRINGNNAVKNPALTKRACAILNRTIEFMPHASYKQMDVLNYVPSINLSAFKNTSKTPLYEGLPACLARLSDTRLLEKDEEPILFRGMNGCKYAASTLRDRLDVTHPDADLMNRIEALLHNAEQIRNVIIEANMRLNFSIAKKYVTPGLRWEDLISDGGVILMRAVDKFDCTRSRFSTYATKALTRHFYDKYCQWQQQQERFITGVTDGDDFRQSLLDLIPTPVSGYSSEKECKIKKATVTKMLRVLEPREQEIIKARFGLGEGREPQTLQEVGDRFGISKQRVRQVVEGAKGKMHAVAPLSLIDDF